MTKRVLIVVALALVASLAAAILLRPESGVPEGAPTLDAMARDVGRDVMELLHKGHVPGRSGEVMLVPKPHHFLIGDWDITTLGTDNPVLSTSHPNPWDYLTKIPIVVVGPGVPEGVVNEEPTDIAQLAPTYAAHYLPRLDDLPAGFADPLPGIASGRTRQKSPKVIFTVVVDGGGWNALQEHRHAWPNIRWLMDHGITYTNATIGSAPSITGALHATFGTGVYPTTHGIPGNQMRGPDGKNTDTWRQDADPRYLETPTVSELWDEQQGNKPVVATVSYEGWHLGMIGHGAQRESGDKDIAVLWEVAPGEESEPGEIWSTNTDYYELPDYLPDREVLYDYTEELDLRDGLTDGTWFGHPMEELTATDGELAEAAALDRPATPAFVRLTGDAVVEVLRRERIGRDELTDFYWVEMKMPDYAGHAYNVTSPEEEDVIRETDAQIGRFRRQLDRLVGRNNYVFALSADHGQQPLPELHGGWRINNKEIERDIIERFGDVIQKVTPVDIYIDADAAVREGVTAEDLARYMGAYTLAENIPDDSPIPYEELLSYIPEERLDDTLFAGAFTTDFFGSLSSEDVEAFGCGRFPEGDLVTGDDCFE